MRATARTADVSKNTVAKLFVDAARASAEYQSRMLRDLPCRRIQVDEIWSYIYAKKKQVPFAKSPPPGAGDVWTWVALCPDTKLVPAWRVGDRSAETGLAFLRDLHDRLRYRVQVRTDDYAVYVDGVDMAFGGEVDHAMLSKTVKADGTVYAHPTHLVGRAGPQAHQHVVGRAPEPDDEDVYSEIRAEDQRLLTEAGEPCALGGAALHALQLLPDA